MKTPADTPNTEYHPPAQDVITHFAQSVGEGLGGDYADADVIAGLADFMTVIARILAQDMNRKGQGCIPKMWKKDRLSISRGRRGADADERRDQEATAGKI